jgi:hypothetical protein
MYETFKTTIPDRVKRLRSNVEFERGVAGGLVAEAQVHLPNAKRHETELADWEALRDHLEPDF